MDKQYERKHRNILSVHSSSSSQTMHPREQGRRGWHQLQQGRRLHTQPSSAPAGQRAPALQRQVSLVLCLSLPAGWHGGTLYFCPQTTPVLLCSPFTRFLLLALPHRAETPELLQGMGMIPRTPPQASSKRKALNSHPENTKGHQNTKGH